MYKVLFYLLSAIAFEAVAAEVDYECNHSTCKIRLFSTVVPENISWSINNVKYEKSTDIELTVQKEEPLISYAVTYNSDSKKIKKSGVIQTNKEAQINTGSADVNYSSANNTYYSIPYHKNSHLLESTEYKLISDHVLSLNSDSSFTKIIKKTGDKKIEHFVASFDNVAHNFAHIAIMERKFTESSTYIMARIKNNINKKVIESVEVLANGQTISNGFEPFEFDSEQKTIALKVMITLTNGETVLDEKLIKNSVMSEIFCEFNLDQDKLISLCIANDAVIEKMSFLIDGHEVGRGGVVEIIKGLENTFTFQLHLSDKNIKEYRVMVDHRTIHAAEIKNN